jgi:hypothetical protein
MPSVSQPAGVRFGTFEVSAATPLLRTGASARRTPLSGRSARGPAVRGKHSIPIEHRPTTAMTKQITNMKCDMWKGLHRVRPAEPDPS